MKTSIYCILSFFLLQLHFSTNHEIMPVKNFSEDLPQNCPPSDAEEVNNIEFIRLVDSIPASEKDFFSHRKLYPGKKFLVSECQAKSISLFINAEGVDIGKYRKLPALKNKSIAIICLKPGDGPVKQTGEYPHHSWWQTTNFIIGDNIKYVSNA